MIYFVFKEIIIIFAINKIKIMNTIALNNLWNYLQGLSLTPSNQRWLAEQLVKSSNEDKKEIDEGAVDGLAFPQLPKNYVVSEETICKTVGEVPVGFDVDEELKNKWQEWVK